MIALRELGRIERARCLFWAAKRGDASPRPYRTGQGRSAQCARPCRVLQSFRRIRDRSFEQQRYRASGLNLVTVAIVLWNTAYVERAANVVRGRGQGVDELLQYLSPLGWEHINLAGDYLWRGSVKIGAGKFRPLRSLQPAWRALFSVF
jgi:hypothetical protein